MNNPSSIERIVMRRVRIIRVLHPLISLESFAVLVLMLTLWGISREVWIARVLQNAPNDLLQLPSFYVAAFSHTRIIVQAFTILTLVSIVYLARETARTISSVLVPVVD